jgi:hypothetical protein
MALQVQAFPVANDCYRAGQPTFDPALLSASMRAPAISGFPERDIPLRVRARESGMKSPHADREKERNLHPFSAPREYILRAQSRTGLRLRVT